MAAIRCFVGLPLPEEWQRGLGRVAQGLAGLLASRIAWTRPGNWHLTLKFLGDVDEARLPELVRALGTVRFAPFVLAVGAAGAFPPSDRVEDRAGERAGSGAPRVLWAGLARGGPESVRLAAGVEAALGPLGFAPESRPFQAHLTLGRVKQAARGDDWALAARAVAGQNWPEARAETFVLWRSVLGPSGPRYTSLAEFFARPE